MVVGKICREHPYPQSVLLNNCPVVVEVSFPRPKFWMDRLTGTETCAMTWLVPAVSRTNCDVFVRIILFRLAHLHSEQPLVVGLVTACGGVIMIKDQKYQATHAGWQMCPNSFSWRAKNAPIMKYILASNIFKEHFTSYKIRQYEQRFTIFKMDFHPFFARNIEPVYHLERCNVQWH